MRMQRRFGIVHPTLDADILLDDGDILKIGEEDFCVYSTPGHTKGGIALVGDRVAFTGDTLFRGSVGRWDFPDSSVDELFSSLRKLLLLPENTKIYCGHGLESTIGDEKKYNPFLKKLLEEI